MTYKEANNISNLQSKPPDLCAGVLCHGALVYAPQDSIRHVQITEQRLHKTHYSVNLGVEELFNFVLESVWNLWKFSHLCSWKLWGMLHPKSKQNEFTIVTFPLIYSVPKYGNPVFFWNSCWVQWCQDSLYRAPNELRLMRLLKHEI